MTTNQRPRILCVDDEPLVLAGLANTLRRRFDVTTAVGGQEGLRALGDQGPFSVVVSDFMMPGMNGAEFLSFARVASPDAVRILLTRVANEGALPTGFASDAATHDAWFRAKVYEALNDPSPVVAGDEVEEIFARRRAAALKKVAGPKG